MAIGPRSRHILVRARRTVGGHLYLTDREPLLFREDVNNRYHEVVAGDTLHTLAESYFAGVTGSANLWWIIADYQGSPIIDPTVRLSPGSVVVIPPEDILYEIFAESRRDQETLAER